MEVPAKILEAAHEYIEWFGEHLVYLGEYKNSAVYQFQFPEGVRLGEPSVYLLKNDKVTIIDDQRVFDILDFFYKDVK